MIFIRRGRYRQSISIRGKYCRDSLAVQIGEECKADDRDGAMHDAPKQTKLNKKKLPRSIFGCMNFWAPKSRTESKKAKGRTIRDASQR